LRPTRRFQEFTARGPHRTSRRLTAAEGFLKRGNLIKLSWGKEALGKGAYRNTTTSGGLLLTLEKVLSLLHEAAELLLHLEVVQQVQRSLPGRRDSAAANRCFLGCLR